MLTVAENIVIPVIGEIKEIAEKYNLSFNDHDTLKSVRDQLLKTKQKHRKLREKYDKLKRAARLAIYDCARAEGGHEVARLQNQVPGSAEANLREAGLALDALRQARHSRSPMHTAEPVWARHAVGSISYYRVDDPGALLLQAHWHPGLLPLI